MNLITSIIFDFDGTLADTATVIVDTMRRTFTDMGLPVPDEEDMRRTIGMKLLLALAKLGNLSDSQAVDATERYKRFFREYAVDQVRLFPGVAETLHKLREEGIRMAIATSRNAESLETILANNDITHCFEKIVSNSDNLAPKPEPEMVLTLLQRMGVGAGETLVVGDTTFDIEMGKRAGCRCCAVTWGNHDIETLATAGPDFYIDNFSELLTILDR